MSFTERTTSEMNSWTEVLEDANDWLETSTQEEIFAFLNKKENLCTPGFLLRRQIQTRFPELLTEAKEISGVDDYADLTDSGNVPWAKEFVETLAKILAKENFSGCGDAPLNIDNRQWFRYLNDETFCNRNTAIKLIFALEMDDATAAKFLLSNGNDLLSMRNPFDFACKILLDNRVFDENNSAVISGFTYADAVKLFDSFEKKRDKSAAETPAFEISDKTFTELVKDETDSVIKDNIMAAEKKKQLLLEIMLKHQKDFTVMVDKKNQGDKKKEERDKKYASGYSLQNMKRLRYFLKYLTLLYPKFLKNTESAYSSPVKTDEDGVPQVYNQLTKAMFDKQYMELPAYSDLKKFSGPELSARGEAKRFYDNIPFNKNIIIPLKSLSKTLRSILRAAESPANAQDINRDTVLLLTYFFITGWLASSKLQKQDFYLARAEVEKNSVEEIVAENLNDVAGHVDAIKDGEEKPLNGFISSINIMLNCFGFTEFYAPFVLDRFILMCLIARNSSAEKDPRFVQYLMELVISESYRLSKEEMEDQQCLKKESLCRPAP